MESFLMRDTRNWDSVVSEPHLTGILQIKSSMRDDFRSVIAPGDLFSNKRPPRGGGRGAGGSKFDLAGYLFTYRALRIQAASMKSYS